MPIYGRDPGISDDPLEDSFRQEDLNTFRSNLIDLMQHGIAESRLAWEFNYVSAEELNEYLYSYISLVMDEVKKPRLSSYELKDPMLIGNILQYLSIVQKSSAGDTFQDPYIEQKSLIDKIIIHILETADSAALIIAADLPDNTASVIIQALESAPEYIKDIYKSLPLEEDSQKKLDSLFDNGLISKGFPKKDN